MVAGTVASVGLALLNEQGRFSASRLQPAMAQAGGRFGASPLQPAMAEAVSSAPVAGPSNHGVFAASREAITRRIGHATLVGLAVLVVAALVPTATTLAASLTSGSGSHSSRGPVLGPPEQLRAASLAGAGWEEAYAAAVPSASDRGAALIAGVDQQRKIDTLIALDAWAQRQRAAAAPELQAASIPARGTARSLNGASGYAPGTVLFARVTIYGCVGRGGGFCGGMSTGITVFEGAAACSNDMPFGTKFKIEGDPTGRTYECLDRGILPSHWVDVFFYNTADGFAWASQLGATSANITIVN